MVRTTAGYSQTPLVSKLGIKAGQRLAILNAPMTTTRRWGRFRTG